MIGLAMIVRDAERTVERAIRSALPIVDRWTIIDTGSTDGTREVVQATLAGVPGELLESAWVGHAHNRTELLAAARDGSDYVLMLDADMEVMLNDELPELTAPAYLLDIHDRALIYPLPLLTDTRHEWFYAGVAHSYLATRTPGDSEPVRLPELSLFDHGGGGGRPGKIERDRDLLALEVARKPTDARSWFYLGQSFRDLDEVEPAIHAFRRCAELGGWDEQVYYALYQAGTLMCEHVNYYEGAKLLLQASDMKRDRAEALRALAGSTRSVADKIPFPADNVLFVREGAYATPEPVASPVLQGTAREHAHKALCRTNQRRVKSLTIDKVSAVVVTRGDVDLAPTLAPLHERFTDVVVWDNSKRENLGPFGRYAAIKEAKHSVIAWVDDDVVFTHWEELVAAYDPELLVCNMDTDWIEGAGYGDFVGMQGAGSICPAWLPARVFAKYREHHPDDPDFLIEADFVFGVLAPFTRVDLPFTVREFSDDASRLYTQPWQTEKKWQMIERCREILAVAQH